MKRGTVSAIVLIAMVCTIVHMWGPVGEIISARERLSQMQIRAAMLRSEIAALQAAVDSADERETIERLARRELGLVYPGEIVFYYAGN